MSPRPVVIGIVVLAGLPTRVEAQQAVAEEPPKVQSIQAVERGAFLETDVGLGLFVNELNDRRYGLSLLTGAFAGYDILPILSLSVGAYAVAASVSRSDSTPDPKGDLFFIAPTAQLQFALVTTERNFVFLRGAVGFAFALPKRIGEDANGDGEPDVEYGGNGPMFAGTVGFERYTKLRHFSIGVHAGAVVVTQPSVGIGISVTPTLKYTF